MTDPRIERVDVLEGGFSTKLDPHDLDEHITYAHRVAEDYLGTEGLDEETMELIEKHLARHSIRVPEADGGDLSSTPHGQTALMLDPTGRLGSTQFEEFFTMG